MKKVRQYIAMAAVALMITSIAPVNVTTYADEVTDTAIENNQITEDESSEELNQISEINSSDSNVVVTNVDENSAYVEVNNATPGFSHIAISYTAKNDPEDCGTKILTGATSGIIDGLKSNTEYEVKAYQINVHVGSNHTATSTSTYLGTTSFKTTAEINSSDSNVVVTNVDENSAYVEVNNATPGFSHIAISYTAKDDPEDCGTKILTGATSGIIDGLKSNTEYEVKAYQINVHVGSNHVATSTSTYLGTTSFKTASEINS